MHEISIGDPVSGFTVLQGPSVAAPNFKAVPYFTFSADPVVQEHIEITLKGTPAQISAFIGTLENILHRAALYDSVSYATPQYLRVKLTDSSGYLTTPISNLSLGSNPAGFISQQQGSKLIVLHYTRPNHFDGPKAELPLSGHAGDNILGGYPLFNHTDSGANHGSSVFINKAAFSTTLPAPLRFQYYFSKTGDVKIKDLHVNIFHHLTYTGDDPFFALYFALTGGTAYANANAIEGYYKRFTWSAASWTAVTSYLLDVGIIRYFSWLSYRPLVHFFNTHAYTDLYFKVQLERSGEVLFVSEPVYSPPNYGYLVLPPIELPPNYLLGENDPDSINVRLYAYRISGASTTIDIDCLTLLPLAYAASFYGFINMILDQTLVDDSSRQRFNLWSSITGRESVAHSRVGGPLLLYPGHHSRVFFHAANDSGLMPIDYTAKVKVFYYPRQRLL